MLFTLDSKKLLGFSDFIPTNSDADWTTWEDWGSGGVCVCGKGVGGRGEGGIKPFQNYRVRGQACLPSLILAFVLSTVACSLDCLTKSNPDGIFLILNAN